MSNFGQTVTPLFSRANRQTTDRLVVRRRPEASSNLLCPSTSSSTEWKDGWTKIYGAIFCGFSIFDDLRISLSRFGRE